MATISGKVGFNAPLIDNAIQNEDGSVRLLLDGVVYNASQLSKEFESRGHLLKTTSETECVVHAYEEYGADCQLQLEGEFAFAIWDEKQKSLLLVRDRLGTKPLLYSYKDSQFCFASDFNSILALSGLKKEVDVAALHHYLSYSYVPAPLTAFKGISKLLPAHRLILRNGRINIERYWDLEFSDGIEITEKAARDETLRLFTNAVKKRLLGVSGPLGAYLSGGIDSSAVVAMMSRLTNRPIKTFSIGFADKQFNEIGYARKVSRLYNSQHYEYVVGPADLKILPQLVQYYGEPFADSSSLPSYYLARLAQGHVQTVLSGDGGDELFAGYQRHWANRWAQKYQRLPAALKEHAVPWLLRHYPVFRNPKNTLGRLKRFLQAAALPCAERYLYWTGIFTPELKQRLYTAEFKKEVCDLDSAQFMSAAFEKSNANDIVHASMYVDTMLHLHNDSNVKVDIAGRVNSLEVMTPFMDEELFDFVRRLPSHYKLRASSSKHILKEAIADFIPAQNIYRAKMGFAMPIHSWFREQAKEMLCDTLFAQRCLKRGYFRPEIVRHLVEEHLLGRSNYSPQLWSLLVLELWQRNFIDQI